MFETFRKVMGERSRAARPVGPGGVVRRGNDPLAAALRTLQPDRGIGPEWQSPVYGEYYARSVDVYAAVKLRAEAAARPPLVVRLRDSAGNLAEAPIDHPVQRLLTDGNPWWSRAGVMIATETYLSLWGAAFWFLGHSGNSRGTPDELWPLRPDRVRVVRDAKKYVSGFVYSESGHDFPMLPEEVVWFRYFNPLEEFAGFSPMAAGRMTADMGIDALRFNREFFRNGAHPQDLVFKAKGPLTDDQVTDFYARLEHRFSGPAKGNRPIVTGDGWDVERLGLNQRDMEWSAGLRGSLEGIARVYGVPLPLLEDFSRATLANVREARRMFWEKTMVPELVLLEDTLNDSLLPKLGVDGERVRLAFDLSVVEALSETETERTKRQVALVSAGIMTVDETRAEQGLLGTAG